MKCFIYWTADLKSSKPWSSQFWTQFKQLLLRYRSLKKSGLQAGFEPVTSRYRCDALTNWAMKPLTLGAGHLWVLMSPWRMDVKWYMKCFIYWTADLKSSKPWLSQLRTQFKQLLIEARKKNCLNCVHICDDHGLLDFKSAVQYMKHFIYHFTSILHGLIRTHKWPAPNVSGFIAQLVRASHRYRKVTGSNLVEVLTFSEASIRNCLNCVHNCDDHGLLDYSILLSILFSLT